MVRIGLLLVILLAWPLHLANAQIIAVVERGSAVICPAHEGDTAPPMPDREGCHPAAGGVIDPQGRHIWVLYDLDLPERAVSDASPLGLGVFAKASSHAYVNGVRVGENGTPADTRAAEVAGLMDRLHPVPPGLLKAGENRVALRMSSHAGALRLAMPVHGVFVAPAGSLQAEALQRYWPSLASFGAFVLAGLYFLVSAIRRRQAAASALLAVMAGAAGLQLMAEVSRGLWAYPYWVHDLRLIVIVACSAVFGASLSIHVILQCQPRARAALIGSALLLILLMVFLFPGFDGKASYALLVSSLFSAGVALSAVKEMKGRAGALAAGLAGFSVLNFLDASQFLDAYFYYAVAALLLLLFIQQAVAFAREEQLRRSEEARADKLQYVLDQLETPSAAAYLSVASAGRMMRIACSDIAFIQGAGDYVELVLASGETVLHTATLADLEAELPSSFLRVHRSYLVNSNQIASLERHASGTGELRLTTGQTVPVSRRIMPKVRAALS